MNEWRDVTLGDLLELHDHKRVPLSAAVRKTRQGPYPYYGAQGVIDHVDAFIFDGRYILIPEDGENLNSRKLPIAYFAEGKFWVNNHAHIATARGGIAVDRFVQSALEATDISGFITGAAQPKLSQANLRRIPLRVPPYDVQLRIAEILEAIDVLIKSIKRRIVLLERIAQVIYREWFVRSRNLDREATTLGEQSSSLVDGDWIETKDQGGADFRLLQVSNIGVGSFRETGNFRFITSETYKRLRCTEIRAGDILISRMPDPIGRAWLVDWLGRPAITSVDVAILTPRSPEIGSFLIQWLNSPETLANADAVATGTTRKRITRSVLAQLKVVMPTASEISRFHAVVTPTAEMASVLHRKNAALTAMRDELLPKLVTGAIDVSNVEFDAILSEAAT